MIRTASLGLFRERLFFKENIMRIILADHHPQALWALKTMLQERAEFEITGEATDADSLLDIAVAYPSDLALIDRELPGRPIEDLIADLHAFKPSPIVVLMSSEPEYGSMLLKAGADAFVSKGDRPEWLLESLEKFEKRSKKKQAEIALKKKAV
jgi:DNA-binding NarL/FixJ family response regulator